MINRMANGLLAVFFMVACACLLACFAILTNNISIFFFGTDDYAVATNFVCTFFIAGALMNPFKVPMLSKLI
tara:strand:+ start:837 stop:1052 length:216 start_codon:yes stop_codon:yes gene_type:complete